MDKQVKVTISGRAELSGADEVRRQAEEIRSSQAAIAEAATEAGSSMEAALAAAAEASRALIEELRRLPAELRAAAVAAGATGDVNRQLLTNQALQGAVSPEATVFATPGAAGTAAALNQKLLTQQMLRPDRATPPTGAEDRPEPRVLLRGAVDALRAGDIEQAGVLRTEAARGAVRMGDQEVFAIAQMVLRAERMLGIGGGPGTFAHNLLQRQFRLIEQHLGGEGGDAQMLPAGVALGRAGRILGGAEASILGGVTRASEIAELEQRLSRARVYLGQAREGGADVRQVEQLNERLEQLNETLQETKQVYERTGQQAAREPGPDGAIGQGLLDEIRGLGRQGLGMMGPLGRILGRVGPIGLAAGAAVGAYTVVGHLINRFTGVAQEEHLGLTDLARQYGYGGTPLELFRDAQGATLPHLREFGYTGSEAARIASLYNLPGGFRGDTASILMMARTTGLSPDALAGATRELGVAGTFARGEAGQALETLKLAMAEGLQLGIAQSDTMRTLVSTVEASYRQGVGGSPEALAFQAALQRQLAGIGPRVLQGEAGMEAQRGLLSAITGQGDIGGELFAIRALGNVSAQDLGLTGAAAAGFTELQGASPVAAGRLALQLVQAGRARPEVAQRLASALTRATAGNPALLAAILGQAGLGAEQALGVLGAEGGVGGVFTGAAADAGRYGTGLGLGVDPQADSLMYTLQQARVDQQDAQMVFQTTLLQEAVEILADRAGLELSVARGFNTAIGWSLPFIMDALSRVLTGLSPEEREAFDLWRRGGDTIPPEGVPESPHPRPTRPQGRGGAVAPTGDPLLDEVTQLIQVLSPTGAQFTMLPRDIYGEGAPAHRVGTARVGANLRIGAQGVSDPIHSPFYGTLAWAGEDSAHGYSAIIRVGDTDRMYRFGHLAEPIDPSRVGQPIARGDFLGMEGTTGDSSGIHLYFGRHGGGDSNLFREPFLRELLEDMQRGPEGSTPREIIVRVEGLERISIEGADPITQSYIREGLNMMVGAVVRQPVNWRGSHG